MSICPLCGIQTSDYYIEKLSDSCEQPDITEDNSRLLCINCGQIGNELFKNNYIDFHENKCRIKKNQSIYENIIFKMYYQIYHSKRNYQYQEL